MTSSWVLAQPGSFRGAQGLTARLCPAPQQLYGVGGWAGSSPEAPAQPLGQRAGVHLRQRWCDKERVQGVPRGQCRCGPSPGEHGLPREGVLGAPPAPQRLRHAPPPSRARARMRRQEAAPRNKAKSASPRARTRPSRPAPRARPLPAGWDPRPAPPGPPAWVPTFLLPEPPRLGVAPAGAAQALGRQGPQVGRRAPGSCGGRGRALAVLAQRLGLQRRQLRQERGARPRRQLGVEAEEVLLAGALQPGADVLLRSHVAAAACRAGTRDPPSPTGVTRPDRRRRTQRSAPAPPRPAPPDVAAAASGGAQQP